MNNTIAKPIPTRRKPSNSNTYSPYPVTIFTTPQQNKTGLVGFIPKLLIFQNHTKVKKKQGSYHLFKKKVKEERKNKENQEKKSIQSVKL